MTVVTDRIAVEIHEHAQRMEHYTLPNLNQGFIDGYYHAIHLFKRDSQFIASSIVHELGL